MKYIIDAYHEDIIKAILEIIELNESYDYMHVDTPSSKYDYFSFFGNIFKIKKHQSVKGCTMIEETDFLDSQWKLGGSHDCNFVVDIICKQIISRTSVCKIRNFNSYEDDFKALQDNYLDI